MQACTVYPHKAWLPAAAPASASLAPVVQFFYLCKLCFEGSLLLLALFACAAATAAAPRTLWAVLLPLSRS